MNDDAQQHKFRQSFSQALEQGISTESLPPQALAR